MKVAPAKTVGKPHKPHKPRSASHITKARTKHAKGKKHHAPVKKHAMTAHQKHLAHLAHLAHIHRGLAIGAEVACCAAEALAASLRLSGLSVTDDDVLALYWRTADDPDAGASIWHTLMAASEFGLAGYRPFAWRHAANAAASAISAGSGSWPAGSDAHASKTKASAASACSADGPAVSLIDPVSMLILGVDLPGPHTVLATPGGWWSWGDLRDPAEWPDALIEEAWAVTWG